MGLAKKIALFVGLATLVTGGAVSYGFFQDYQEKSIAMGFSGAFERWSANNAGIDDPKKWAAKVESDRRAALEAEERRHQQEKAEAEEKRKKAEATSLSIAACIKAQSAVTARLKAPSTAKFPDCGWSLYEYDVRMSDDQRTVFVRGYVDAQNSFGAMLRNQFIVKFSHVPNTTSLNGLTVTDVALGP